MAVVEGQGEALGVRLLVGEVEGVAQAEKEGVAVPAALAERDGEGVAEGLPLTEGKVEGEEGREAVAHSVGVRVMAGLPLGERVEE